MTKYLITFPASAMNIAHEDLAAVGEAARTVIREAKEAGVYVFGGGINAAVAPLMVAADATVTHETYPQTKEFDGGFCVLELPSRTAAVHWAAKIAQACRCSQELREFGYDPRELTEERNLRKHYFLSPNFLSDERSDKKWSDKKLSAKSAWDSSVR